MARSLAMRLSFAVVLLVGALSSPALASAQSGGGALDPESYVSLSVDQRAQLTLSGFRLYLERIREGDEELYGALDPRLHALEERDVIADAIFWSATGLSLGAVAVGIPVYQEVSVDAGIGLLIGAAGTFVLGVIIQALIRPGHDELMALIDLHDEQVGRR